MFNALFTTASNRTIPALLLAAAALMTNPAFAAGDAAAGETKAQACAGCHSSNGTASVGENPNLAGQHEGYVAKQLANFKAGERVNAIMAGMAAGLSDQDMQDIGAFYASLPIIPGVADKENLQRGEDIYRGGITDAGIAACSGCHGASGKGNPAAGFPVLSGQNPIYTVTQLKAFRSKARANDANAMMRSIAHRLTDDEIDALANYISGLH